MKIRPAQKEDIPVCRQLSEQKNRNYASGWKDSAESYVVEDRGRVVGCFQVEPIVMVDNFFLDQQLDTKASVFVHALKEFYSILNHNGVNYIWTAKIGDGENWKTKGIHGQYRKYGKMINHRKFAVYTNLENG